MFNDLFITPFTTTADPQYQMVVVVHYRIGANVDGEQSGEQVKPLDYPLAAMFVAATGISVGTAKKGATNTTRNAMVIASMFLADQGVSGFWHNRRPTESRDKSGPVVRIPCHRVEINVMGVSD